MGPKNCLKSVKVWGKESRNLKKVYQDKKKSHHLNPKKPKKTRPIKKNRIIVYPGSPMGIGVGSTRGAYFFPPVGMPMFYTYKHKNRGEHSDIMNVE